MSEPVDVAFSGLGEALQDAFVRQRTGTLTCTIRDRQEVFFVLSGLLYLSGSNPCRDRLEAIFAGPQHGGDAPRFDPQRYLSKELSSLVRELSERLVAWRVEEVRLRERLENVPDDIVGPLPTADLVMELATRGVTHEALQRRLGGPEASYRSLSDHRARQRVPYLGAEEVRLLDRLEKRATLGVLMEESGDGPATARQLARLVSVGLLEAVGEISQLPAAASDDALAAFADRIGDDLDAHPLDLDPKFHRLQLQTMLDSYGRLGYYELLGLGANAPAKEVHEAFMGLARLAHPRHAEPLGMESSKDQMERLLIRLSEAYLALSDPEDEADYRASTGVLESPLEPKEPAESLARRSEREEVARQSYRTALDCIEVDDYYYAIQLLERATRADPKPEYYTMLGLCQRKNPNWLHMAVDSFQEALSLSPGDEELKQYLTEAKQEYREHVEARESAAALEPASEPEDPLQKEEAERVQRALSKLKPS